MESFQSKKRGLPIIVLKLAFEYPLWRRAVLLKLAVEGHNAELFTDSSASNSSKKLATNSSLSRLLCHY